MIEIGPAVLKDDHLNFMKWHLQRHYVVIHYQFARDTYHLVCKGGHLMKPAC